MVTGMAVDPVFGPVSKASSQMLCETGSALLHFEQDMLSIGQDMLGIFSNVHLSLAPSSAGPTVQLPMPVDALVCDVLAVSVCVLS